MADHSERESSSFTECGYAKQQLYTKLILDVVEEGSAGDYLALSESDTKLLKRGSCSVVLYALLASLGSLASGYSGGVMGGAVLFIEDDMQITEIQEEVLVGSLVLISLVGGIIAGLLGDAFGRRKTMATAATVIVFGCAIMALASSYWILLTGRVLTGIGVGFPFVIVPLYIAEVSSAANRGTLTSFPEIFFNSGLLLGYISSFCLAALPVTINWRLMLGLGAAPAIVLAGATFVLPESPRWLVSQNRIDEAFAVLLKVYGDRKDASTRLSSIILATQGNRYGTDMHSLSNDNTASERGGGVWRELLCPSSNVARVLFASLGLQFFQQVSGISAVVYYTPAIFEQAGFKSNFGELGGAVMVMLSKTLFILVATVWIDRTGRKPLLFLSCIGMTASMLIVAFSFLLVGTEAAASSSAWGFGNSAISGSLAVACTCAFASFFSMGIGPISGLLPAELFPLRLRAQGLSLCMALNRLLSGLNSLTFLSLQHALSPAGVFLLFAAMSAVSVLFVYYVIPETRGQNLEEISKD